MQNFDNTSKKLASNTSVNIHDDLQRIKQDSAHIAETLIAQGHEKYDEIKSNSLSYIKLLEKQITSKPVQSVAIAIGTGLLLSLLLKRR
jgi:ElaB/YqjD/DUF883 family membrane-anchored ribosome-binding protein